MAHTPPPYAVGDPIRNAEGEIIGTITGVTPLVEGDQAITWSLQVEFEPGVIEGRPDILGLSIHNEEH